jgi:hypothetical protein
MPYFVGFSHVSGNAINTQLQQKTQEASNQREELPATLPVIPTLRKTQKIVLVTLAVLSAPSYEFISWQ